MNKSGICSIISVQLVVEEGVEPMQKLLGQKRSALGRHCQCGKLTWIDNNGFSILKVCVETGDVVEVACMGKVLSLQQMTKK